MSWMDSWSRPGKRSAVPPPFYITQGENASYCHTCGRVMSSRKVHQAQSKVIKYCSDGCRHRKPGPLDRRIEKAIVALLNAEPDSRIEETAAASKMVKGDRRIVVTCDEVEAIMFGDRPDQSKTSGQVVHDSDVVAEDANKIHPRAGLSNQAAQPPNSGPESFNQEASSDTNDSSEEGGRAGHQHESRSELSKMQAGQRRAEHREMVRRAARRAVVFGFVQGPAPIIHDRASGKRGRRSGESTKPVDQPLGPVRRKCEALMNGSVVEPSFAKGNWAIRWREDT